MTSAVTSAGTSWKKSATGSNGPRPASARAASWPVASHHSPAVSPGAGIIGLTSTTSRTGTRSATSGATYAPIDWATTTVSRGSAAPRAASAASA